MDSTGDHLPTADGGGDSKGSMMDPIKPPPPPKHREQQATMQADPESCSSVSNMTVERGTSTKELYSVQEVREDPRENYSAPTSLALKPSTTTITTTSRKSSFRFKSGRESERWRNKRESQTTLTWAATNDTDHTSRKESCDSVVSRKSKRKMSILSISTSQCSDPLLARQYTQFEESPVSTPRKKRDSMASTGSARGGGSLLKPSIMAEGEMISRCNQQRQWYMTIHTSHPDESLPMLNKPVFIVDEGGHITKEADRPLHSRHRDARLFPWRDYDEDVEDADSATHYFIYYYRNMFPDNLVMASFSSTKTVYTKVTPSTLRTNDSLDALNETMRGLINDTLNSNTTDGVEEDKYERSLTSSEGTNVMGMIVFCVAFGSLIGRMPKGS
ncbi:hypothetical protein Pcinc_041400 [Petrolisthes cinctipes]|uniref:Uncharacterized protein n=1 Tax=Petrolisthes cinctipes TaxID=88211 RepID=A0AAE1BJL9_PETCI|nr:hypothetical protein Pcinc_041400 [Petrolisthes cinctipes]